ncbi:uroporphyrinogen-III synthase-like [Phlebotomus argentipes]|uniref:uroporphyrinogen-III synthase-like n=1 Tax=Phlebotomus argentipes TaxID=94469 RepID=UPI0028932509|nr:uroporphyrinogen-III synthase-like [Phlebotomus argentipes]
MMKNLVVFKSAVEESFQQEMLEKFSEHHISATFISPLIFSFKNLQSWGRILKESNTKFTGIIFTSPRAVEASAEAIEGESVHPSWQEACNYCVGPSTSILLASKINLHCHGEESGNAEALSAFILQDLHKKGIANGTFLFPCGNLKLGILERKLQEGGFAVNPIEIYETICNPTLGEEIENNFPENAEFLLFYSPSCVKFTLPLLREKCNAVEKFKFLAIGPSTKKAIEEEGLEVFKACEKPTFESVLEVLS